MPKSLTLNVPDDVYQSLLRIADETGQTPEELAIAWWKVGIRSYDEDPLLKLVGCIESDITDVAERHDHYLGEALMEEMRRSGGG